MPIHVRANQGDYAEACLLPGDPLRAKYIADTFMEDVVQRNAERGMLGYTGTFNGTPVSVQASGMGCPSAAIVIEELVQLGVKKLMRVGTCGGLQPDLAIGDLVIAMSATAADATASHYVGDEPHAPTADFGLVHEAVHQAKHLGKPVRVGPIVSSDIFYPPDPDQARRWSDRGILAVEMEAAVLFTLGALRRIQAGCMLIVSDVIVEGEFVRISDEDMRKAVDQMTELALVTVTSREARAGRPRRLRDPVRREESSSSSIPRAPTGRRGDGGPRSRAGRPRSGSRATPSSASARATSAAWRARRPLAVPGCSSSSAATGR